MPDVLTLVHLRDLMEVAQAIGRDAQDRISTVTVTYPFVRVVWTVTYVGTTTQVASLSPVVSLP